MVDSSGSVAHVTAAPPTGPVCQMMPWNESGDINVASAIECQRVQPRRRADVGEHLRRARHRIDAEHLPCAEIRDQQCLRRRMNAEPEQMRTRAGNDKLTQQLAVRIEHDDPSGIGGNFGGLGKPERGNIDVAARIDRDPFRRRGPRRQSRKGRGRAADPRYRRQRNKRERQQHGQGKQTFHRWSPPEGPRRMLAHPAGESAMPTV